MNNNTTSTTASVGSSNSNDDDDDNFHLVIQYKEKELGKNVWIKFPVEYDDDDEDYDDDEDGDDEPKPEFKFYKGTITQMHTLYPNNDTTKPLEYLHFVYFGDTDE